MILDWLDRTLRDEEIPSDGDGAGESGGTAESSAAPSEAQPGRPEKPNDVLGDKNLSHVTDDDMRKSMLEAVEAVAESHEDGDSSGGDDEPSDKKTPPGSDGKTVSPEEKSAQSPDRDAARDDTDEPGDSSSEEGEESPPPSRTQEELTEAAKLHGLSDEEIERQGDNLEATLDLLESRVRQDMLNLERQRKAKASEKPPEEPKDEKPAEGEKQPEQEQIDLAAKIKALKDEGYDEGLVGLLEGMAQQNDLLKQALSKQVEESSTRKEQEEAYRQQQAEERQRQEVAQFMESLDKLGRNDLFGTTKAADDDQQKRMMELFQESDVRREAMVRRGHADPGYSEALVRQSYESAFSEEATKDREKKRAKTLKKQSDKKMGQPRSPEVDARTVPWDGDPIDDPAIAEFAKQHGLTR